MEITIDNAFMAFIKMSLGPLLKSFETLTQNIQIQSYHVARAILEKPFLSSMLITCIIVLLMSIITLSMIVLSAVFCAAVVIVIFEGFVFNLVLILAAVISISLLGLLIFTSGIKMMYQTYDDAE